MRAGLMGGVISFLGFTLPSVIALIMFAIVLENLNVESAGWLHGLKIVAVVIVLQAVLDMGRKLAAEKQTASIAVMAAAVTLVWQSSYSQILVIVTAGVFGLMLLKPGVKDETVRNIHVPLTKTTGAMALLLFFAILMVLPIISKLTNSTSISLFDSFYRSGALVFGGGHVVLPLLERELVPQGYISKEAFLAGYGATQAVPGPLFTFSSYLGASINGWGWGLLATVAIFLPAFLLVIGTLPFWEEIRRKPSMQGALAGVNAAVVGILLAALYNPIFTGTIQRPADFAFAVILFCLLSFWKLPSWAIVLLGAGGGILISYYGT